MACLCREFEFSLLSGPDLEATAVMQRMQVNAAIATVQLAYGGNLVLETTDLTAQAFKVLSHCLLTPCRTQPQTPCTGSCKASARRIVLALLAQLTGNISTLAIYNPLHQVASAHQFPHS